MSPVVTTTLSKEMDEHFKLVNNVVDIVYRANRTVCVTRLRYKVDRPECSYAQVQVFARKKEDEKSQHFVNVKYEIKEFIHLLDVVISVYDKVIA